MQRCIVPRNLETEKIKRNQTAPSLNRPTSNDLFSVLYRFVEKQVEFTRYWSYKSSLSDEYHLDKNILTSHTQNSFNRNCEPLCNTSSDFDSLYVCLTNLKIIRTYLAVFSSKSCRTFAAVIIYEVCAHSVILTRVWRTVVSI